MTLAATRPRTRLVIFDVDGTLVDSQDDIIASMRSAFTQAGLAHPEDDAVRAIVGLSLDMALPRLAPDAEGEMHSRMVGWYKQAYMTSRLTRGVRETSPLYPGVAEGLAALAAQPGLVLGIATGKSRRGLDTLLEGHGLTGHFATCQVADDHPSKPHPSMVLAALAETGVAAQDAVMIGDTSYDRDMARAAGVGFVGVSWGYHPVESLTGGAAVVDSFAQLPKTLGAHWEALA